MSLRSDFLLRSLLAGAACFLGFVVAQEEESPVEESEEEAKPFRILLIQGGANHPFEKRGEILRRGIEERVAREIDWAVIGDLSGRSDLEIPELMSQDWKWDFDLIVHDHCYSRVSDPAAISRVVKPHLEGIPAVVLHASIWSFPGESGARSPWNEITGLEVSGETIVDGLELSESEKGDLPFSWEADSAWPRDEVYLFEGEKVGISPFLLGKTTTGSEVPVAWTTAPGGEDSRVFVTTLGHRTSSLARSDFLDLVSRGVLWALDEDEEYISVAEEESLKGLTLTPLPIDPLRIVPGAARQGRAIADSENRSEGYLSIHAIDGDPTTYWEADRAGPTFWSLQLPEEREVRAIAVAGKDLQLPEVLLEFRATRGGWKEISPPDPYVEKMRKGVRFWRLPDDTILSEIRITFPSSRPGERHGLRDVAVFTSEEDIPSRFVAGNPSFQGDGLQALIQPHRNPEVRLREGWNWKMGSSLPLSQKPKDWFETASGDIFLLSSPGETEGAAILLGRGEEGTLEWIPFLENLPASESIGAFWDGEWLSVVVDGQVTAYRDSDGDGKADEKKERGVLRLNQGETLHQLRLGMEGWVYGLSSRENGEIRGEVFRFPRHGGDRQALFTSKHPLESFWIEAPGKIWVQSRGLADGNPFPILPLHFLPFGEEFAESFAEGRASSSFPEDSLFFTSGNRVYTHLSPETKQASLIYHPIAEIEGLHSVSSVGNRILVVHEHGDDLRLSVLSRGTVEVPTAVLDEINNEELANYLDSPSPLVRLETVFELFRRKRDLTKTVARTSGKFSKGGRVARLAYFSQLASSSSLGYLVSSAKSEDPRLAFALLETHPAAKNLAVYDRILEIEDPEVTAQILATLDRTESDLGPLVYDLTKNDSEILAATATSYLFKNENFDPIWLDLAEGADPVHALSLLPYLEDNETIDRLIELVDKSSDPEFQRAGLRSLAKLFSQGRQSQDKGRARIGDFFRESLRDQRFAPDFLLTEMQHSGINPGSLSFLVSFARENLSFESFALGALEAAESRPAGTREWLEELSNDESRDSVLRMRAYRLLLKDSPEKEESLFEFVVPLLDELASVGLTTELLELWFDSMTEEHGLSEFQRLATNSGSVEYREVFWRALWDRIGNPSVPREQQENLVAILDQALATGKSFELAKIILGVDKVPGREKPEDVPISPGEEGARSDGKAEEEESNPDKELVSLVREAISKRANLDEKIPERPLRSVETIVSQVESATPTLARGWEVFQNSRCADCHNIHREGTILGPDIVAATLTKSTKEFVEIFETGREAEENPYRAYQLELESGQVVTGWIMEEGNGDLRLLDIAGNVFRVPLESIRINRGMIGPQMGNKGKRAWSAEELASLRAFLKSLDL